MRAKTLWAKLPKQEEIPDHLKEFWTFVAERQAVWYRRFVLKQKPPWTENPILRDYKFTNVYRELDRGTIWYMENVVPKHTGKLHRLLWATVMYRLVNNVETFEEVPIPRFRDWLDVRSSFRTKLLERQGRANVFTTAHLTLPSRKGQLKVDRLMEVMNHFFVQLIQIVPEIEKAKSLEEVFTLLQEIECVGRFISYEICCDLMLCKAIPFTENDWVNPGPGCKRGINWIWPEVKQIHEYQDKIQFLRKNQKFFFKKFGLKFYRYNHQPMTLRGIEHSLCEFQKYVKMQHKIGKQRMHFTPRDQQQLLRFPR